MGLSPSPPRRTALGYGRFWPHASAFATTTRRPASTRPRTSRRSTGRSTAGSTWTRRRSSTTTSGIFRPDPPAGAAYVLPTAPIGQASFFKEAERDIRGRLVEKRALEVFRNRALKLTSRPGESRDDFLARCDEAAQANADKESAKLTARLEAKKDRLQSAIELAQRRVDELDADTRNRTANELVAGAGAVLGALFGGRRSTRSITTAISGAASRRGTTMRTTERRKTAEARLLQSSADLEQLEQEILDELAEIDSEWSAKAQEVESVPIRLEATDLRVTQLALVWVPSS